LVTRNIPALNKILSELETVGRKIDFRINEEKTTYIQMSPTLVKRYCQNLATDYCRLQENESFTYLGSVLDNGNKCGHSF
jgi:2-oxoglutarate dehydrogenase complex dehydrogenase (E1) component-like enzyme